jgi:diaminopimelate decarboxylase
VQVMNEMLLELAEEHGTPLYVYDGDLILRRYRELYEHIKWPKLQILYAMKANYNFAILQMLREAGAWLDTVSPAKALLARKAGFPVDRLLYTANNMTDAEVAEVHQTGVLMNIGSLSRLEKYGKAYPGSRICIRFNPDVVAGSHEKIQTGGDLTKFGILMQDAPAVAALAKQYSLQVVGLHCHTGSGIADTGAVYQSMRNLLSVALWEQFAELEFVDFGGGFKVPYKPDERRIDYDEFGAEITRIFSDFCSRYGSELAMYFEPGKYVVAESGHLLTRVNTIKENRGKLIAGTDSGFPQLIRPTLYDAYHQIYNLSNPNGPEMLLDICGNICETGDRFAEQRPIQEVREGDLLDIRNAGAYCYSMGSIYNVRAMPAEILVQEGQAKLVRRRLNNEELVDQIIGECP